MVVGGGILGTALARRLQRRSGNVILVERDVEPQGATAFSFASLSAFDEPVTELYALKSLGMSEWRRWAREIPETSACAGTGRCAGPRIPPAQLAAGKVVVATGAETHDFLDQLGWDVPVEARPGLVVSTEPTDPVLAGTVYVYPVEGPPVHLRQAGDGTVLIGEGSQDFDATDPTNEHGRLLFEQAAQAAGAHDPARGRMRYRPAAKPPGPGTKGGAAGAGSGW